MSLNPLTWPLAGKLAAVGVVAAGAAGASAAVATGYANTPGEPGIATYMCSGRSSDMLLQWRDSSGDLSGTYENAGLSGQAPTETVSSGSGGLSGTVAGTAITLSVGLSQPLYGTCSGSQLTLNVPQQDGTIQAGTCTQATISQWNNTIASLNGTASSDNNTALQQQAQASSAAAQQQAQQQHDQQVSQAQQSLSGDVSTLASDAGTLNGDKSLGGDITTMKNDYQTGQNDWDTEQSDSCSNFSSDSTTVDSDATTVDSDLTTLHSDIQTLQSGDIQSVQTDLSNVQFDLSTLSGLGATPDTNASPAIAAGNQALKSAANAITWANQNGNSIDTQAHALATTADSFANSHGC